MRKWIALLLTGMMCFTMLLPAYAAEEQGAAADTLHQLGLFDGIGTNPDGTPNYDLDRRPTRQEAVIMLIRLLGKEEEALDGNWRLPFRDVVSWAKPYVGYAYEKGLTSGVGNAKFGGEQYVDAAQYITFVLRALGYESGTDFDWAASWEKSDELGITDGSYYKNSGRKFTRGDMTIISVKALQTAKKGESETLLEELVKSGAVKESDVQQSGIMESNYTSPYLLFVREILAAESETVQIPLKDGKIDDAVLAQYVGEFDVYMEWRSVENPQSLQQRESALVSALEQYVVNCIDGDYTDRVNTNYAFPYMIGNYSNLYAFLLTDGKGMVTGYGVYTERDPEEITVHLCQVDSLKTIDLLLEELDRRFAELPEIACDAKLENGEFCIRFHDLPENAAWIGIVGSGATYEGREFDPKLKVSLCRYSANLLYGKEGGVAAAEEIRTESFTPSSGAILIYQILAIMDADYRLIGYACPVVNL